MQKISLDALAREHLKRAHSAPSGRSTETVYGYAFPSLDTLISGLQRWDEYRSREL
jgi:hypothetical protein